MKMLVHREVVGNELAASLEAVKLYLRADQSDEDAAITNMIRTATFELEEFAGLAVLIQTIRVTIFDPPSQLYLSLPIGPVVDDAEVVVTIDGVAFIDFQIETGHRPVIRWGDSFDLLTPTRLTVEYSAGFGATSEDVPADLAQAIMDQTALHYDGRSPMDARSLTTSPHMARIGARYRGVRA